MALLGFGAPARIGGERQNPHTEKVTFFRAYCVSRKMANIFGTDIF